jgi:magnesium-protoporphyrin O-methyltransferase
MEGLERAGYRDATLLEIGSGVGHLHQTLLEQGAASATGIDLAPDMIAEARAWAHERGLDKRTEYLEGDYLALAGQIAAADITLLDKVVCCYPDAQGLIERSLTNTRRVYALSYPRDRWFTRLGAAIASLLMWLMRSEFRPYVHDPDLIAGTITAGGFQPCYENQTPIWLTQVYVKAEQT